MGAGDQVLPSETLGSPAPLRVSVQSLEAPSPAETELGGDTVGSGVMAVYTCDTEHGVSRRRPLVRVLGGSGPAQVWSGSLRRGGWAQQGPEVALAIRSW